MSRSPVLILTLVQMATNLDDLSVTHLSVAKLRQALNSTLADLAIW